MYLGLLQLSLLQGGLFFCFMEVHALEALGVAVGREGRRVGEEGFVGERQVR